MTAPEKIVYIRRKISFNQEANNDPEVQEYFNMSYRAIGSYFKEFGKQYGTGLTREEEYALMPEITGYFPDLDKRDFKSSVNQFFRNINTKIPGEGLRLNIALEQPDKPLSEKNPPVKITDYIVYKHALSHPEVSPNFEEAEKYDHKKFYIEDEQGVIAEASVLNEKEDKARIEYYEIIDNDDKVDQMLTLMGVSSKGYSRDEKKLALKQFVTIDPKKSQEVNEKNLDEFVELSKDKHLETKFKIEEMIRVNVLERIGMRILIKESGEEIGKDIREATLWFEDKGNSKEVNVLSARFKEFAK